MSRRGGGLLRLLGSDDSVQICSVGASKQVGLASAPPALWWFLEAPLEQLRSHEPRKAQGGGRKDQIYQARQASFGGSFIESRPSSCDGAHDSPPSLSEREAWSSTSCGVMSFGNAEREKIGEEVITNPSQPRSWSPAPHVERDR